MKSSWKFISLFLLLSLTVYPQDFQITIDGEKDAFYNTLTGPNDGWFYVPPDAFISANGAMPDDASDLSALVWSAWDDTYLYIYVEVTDDNVQLNNTTDWQNDCVELKMDPDPALAATSGICAINLTALGEEDATGPAAGVGGWSNLDADDNWSGTPNGADDYARKLTDNGYVLEFRLTIDSIKTADGRQLLSEVGSIFGVAFNVHENDAVSGGRDGSIQWSAEINDAVWSSPNLLGQVELLEGNKLAWRPENLITGVANENPDWYIPTPSTGVSEGQAVVKNFALSQNYPNPFNPSTTISYTLQKQSEVKLSVYDVLGHEVAVLVNGVKPAGTHTLQFRGSNLSSGVYLYKLQSEGKVITKKMALMK